MDSHRPLGRLPLGVDGLERAILPAEREIWHTLASTRGLKSATEPRMLRLCIQIDASMSSPPVNMASSP